MKLIKRNTEPAVGFDSMLDHFFTDNFLNWPAVNSSFHRGHQPSYNIKEDNDHWEVDLAVPGMRKEDFKIDLDKDVLSISTEKSESREEQKDNYKVKQFGHMKFTKTFRLPENMVNEDDISASYNDGVLHITLPKREELKSKVKREISIG